MAVVVPRPSGSAASSGGGLLSHQMRGEANGNGHARSDGSDHSADARANLDAWDARGAPPAVKTRRSFAVEVGRHLRPWVATCWPTFWKGAHKVSEQLWRLPDLLRRVFRKRC